MCSFRKVYIVQSACSSRFLCSLNGDVGFTSSILKAGKFFNKEEACETALNEIGEDFLLFTFFEKCDDEDYSGFPIT